MALVWTEDTDDSENTRYAAASAKPDDMFGGPVGNWVVIACYRINRVFWSPCKSDMELVSDADCERKFPTADAAKAWCEAREQELLTKGAEPC